MKAETGNGGNGSAAGDDQLQGQYGDVQPPFPFPPQPHPLPLLNSLNHVLPVSFSFCAFVALASF